MTDYRRERQSYVSRAGGGEGGQGWDGRTVLREMWVRQESRETGRRRQETGEGGKDYQMRRWRSCGQHSWQREKDHRTNRRILLRIIWQRPSCNNTNIPRRSTTMGSGSCAEENEKNGKEGGKDQVNNTESRRWNHCETTSQAVHKVHKTTTHP